MVWCMFEQSGIFKNEFKKLGIDAVDLDILNDFGQTDYEVDLFAEIEKAYGGGVSIFDKITGNDLIFAFFPCTYFCDVNCCKFSLFDYHLRCLEDTKKIKKILERNEKRNIFYILLLKFVFICLQRKIKMILENPYSQTSFLTNNFLKSPDVIDMNRMVRGDFFRKPTAYWFWNFEPTHLQSLQNDKKKKTVYKEKNSREAGMCSPERSMMSSDYARNFICDFILGKKQEGITENMLFDF